MKKILIALFITCISLNNSALAKTDKFSEEYLTEKHHFSIMNPIVENVVEKVLKKSINKEAPGKYKVKFTGYTLSSMKQGIFKSLDIKGKNINADGINVPYVHIKTISNYNWIDYNQDPVVFKTDVNFEFDTQLDEKSINQALLTQDFRKQIQKVNKLAYPLFMLKNVQIKVKNSKIHIVMEYSNPMFPNRKSRTFTVACGFKVIDGKICATDVGLDKTHKHLPLDKITNLINMIDPLTFTLSLLENNNCQAKIENVIINDDIIKVQGKVLVKGVS